MDEPTSLKALGRRIRELRDALGISMGKAAKRAGLTSAYWSTIENAAPGKKGVPSLPSVPAIRAIADALDADRSELLDLAGYEEDAAFDRARTARMEREATIRLSASGVDLSELADLDPEGFDSIVRQAEMLLRRARQARES